MSMQPSKKSNSNHIVIPRWSVPFTWAAIMLVIHGLLPWAVSTLGPRLGWGRSTPSSWNLAGLAIVAIGILSYAYCLVFHYGSYTTSVQIRYAPPRLVKSGPYKISRNPMYVSGLFTWLGWAVYFGSPAVLIALALLWLVFTLRVIPHEERLLEQHFGEEYLEFKRSVRRWIGRY